MDKQIKETLIYLGNSIKNERKRQGITRKQMEYLSEVSVDTIKRMEAGKPVSSEKLLRIVMTLDVPFSVLLPSPQRNKITIRQEINKLLDELEK